MESFLYKAQSITDGEFVIGALLHTPNSPIAYIATIEAMKSMCVDRLNGGKTENLSLTRVMIKSIEPYIDVNEKTER